MAKALTVRFCEGVRPKTGKDGAPVQTGYPDSDPKGLELRVSAEGRKVWSFRYRTLDRKQRRLTLGTFAPGEGDAGGDGGESEPLTLKAARRKARKARAVVEDGGDPAAERRKERDRRQALTIRTFNELADAYLLACERGEWKPKGKKKRATTLKHERGILKRYVRPVIGDTPYEEVTRAKVKALLRAMIARGIGAQTNRTQAVIRQVFAWAIAEELVETNPATGFAPLAAESPRSRTLRDEELKTFWQAVKRPAGLTVPARGKMGEHTLWLSRPVAIALQLAAMLLQRRTEVSGMALDELDLENGTWLIPPERSKNNRPHLVPLTDEAVTLIREAIELARLGIGGNAIRHVFPGRDPTKPMRHDSLTHAMRDVADATGIKGVTVHDLRRTGATVMASERLSISTYMVSKVLGHSSDTGGAAAVTTQHYALYDFAAEKRQALSAWSNLLLIIVGDRPRADNVRPIREAVA